MFIEKIKCNSKTSQEIEASWCNDKQITINHEDILTYIKPKPHIIITEELYQRKGVTDKYYKWLKENQWLNEDGNWVCTHNIIINQKDFKRAKEYGVSKAFDGSTFSINYLHKMYDALKDDDKYIYNSW